MSVPEENGLPEEAHGYRLMTAEIVYSTEDEPEEQSIFVWSDFDHMPDFPRLKRFLDYWQESGSELHSVTVTHIGSREEPACRFSTGSHMVH